MKIRRNNQEIEIHTELPALPLRDIVIFPYTIYPLLIGRQFTINALQAAMLQEKQVFLSAQKRPEEERPEGSDLYQTGIVARVLQVMKLPNGALKALVEGLTRARVRRFSKTAPYFIAEIEPLQTSVPETRELEALLRTVSDSFTEYVRLNRRIPEEVVSTISGIDDAGHLSDTIAAQLLVKLETTQTLLESVRIADRLNKLVELLSSEIEILKLEKKIDSSVRDSLSQGQREQYLQQQLKAIREELGQYEEPGADVDELMDKLEQLQAPEHVKERAEEEIRKLSRMHPYSAEAAVGRGYLDWLFCLPWQVETEDRHDFTEVERMLDADHHGLEKPKRRILEHLASLKISQRVRGPILCFVGPPGVGKTSLGKSIAGALGRKFVRTSLGGIHDEAEIRGHRRTYIGSLPGRIIQGLKKAGSRNPLFLLDEIDKVGVDFRGDPASALLEALDPEQNSTFSDNYLEVDFDLSRTLFITTANSTAGIPHALLDRMEVIHLSGYAESEKMNITREFLIPKLIKEMGLTKIDIQIPDESLLYLIRNYTHESGVRESERKLSALLRQVAVKLARRKSKSAPKPFTFSVSDMRKILGPERHSGAGIKEFPTPGYALGLAWTRLGGETLPVEATVMSGKGKLTLTGQLGEVM
ncbi:MAG: endopeptidase La, partial [Candidatus Zixiibacteriota bacterium]